MIYEIDESCLDALYTKDSNCIAFLEQLALDRRKCKNIIVSKREVFSKLSKLACFSDVAREIYKILGNRVSECKLILKHAKKYCKIVSNNTKETLVSYNGKEIIIINVNRGVANDFTSKSLMLSENEEDIDFYKLLGQYFVQVSKIGNIKIDFEPRNGGGSTTYAVLQSIISERSRMCLCIVDSDKKYGSAAPRETMKKVQETVEGILQDYFEVIYLDVHEVENLLPLNVLDNIIKVLNVSRQGLNFMNYLIEQDNTKESPVFYFDLKKGIPKTSYFIEENANEEQQKKYRRLDAYREYWRNYIQGFGVEINDKNEFIIYGVCDKTLRHALEYFEILKKEGKLETLIVEPHLKEIWLDIGEKVYCWGCVGGRIAV